MKDRTFLRVGWVDLKGEGFRRLGVAVDGELSGCALGDAIGNKGSVGNRCGDEHKGCRPRYQWADQGKFKALGPSVSWLLCHGYDRLSGDLAGRPLPGLGAARLLNTYG